MSVHILLSLYSLKGCQESWKKKLSTLPEIEMLMANCILAAAITVYCGPLKTSSRHKFFDSLQKVCQSQGFPAADQGMENMLKLEDYSKFMLGVVRTLVFCTSQFIARV